MILPTTLLLGALGYLFYTSKKRTFTRSPWTYRKPKREWWFV